MNNLHETLEICLRDIEQGADIDTVLFRYPDLADELRPILEASVSARSMAIPAPSAEVGRRTRARVLQRAAEMRESKTRTPARRIWSVSLRRVAVMLVVVAVLFVSGTSLVRAASTTLPGDNLYPVKRTWEDVLLLFTFNSQQRETLEIEHENERHHELKELFAEGRSEDVEFAGLVTSQNGNEWIVSGIKVVISNQTEIRDQGIVVDSAVRVEGQTQGTTTVVAEEIRLLPSGAKLPELDDEEDGEKENHEGKDRQEQDNSGKGSGAEESDNENQNSDSESDDDSSNSGSGSDNRDLSSDDSDDDSRDDSSGGKDDRQDDDSDNSGHADNDNEDDSGGDD